MKDDKPMFINGVRVVPVNEPGTFGPCLGCGEEKVRDGALVCVDCRAVEAELLGNVESHLESMGFVREEVELTDYGFTSVCQGCGKVELLTTEWLCRTCSEGPPAANDD
ncbi:hypothetical protein DZC31_30020 (plasmid) [Stenotrophomonas rhizophila]|nr:hypothetical protein DZC31_30020 [Stenotrophomonas rhizophila]